MADQRQPFRFRLPWLSAPPPSRPTPAMGTESVPIQQSLFQPAEIAPTPVLQRAEEAEVASPPPSTTPPTTQFGAVFVSPLLSPRARKEPAIEITSQPLSPSRLSIEAPSQRTVLMSSYPSSSAIHVQSNSQPHSPPLDLYTSRQENLSPKLTVPTDSDLLAINGDAKGEAKKERREIGKDENPEPMQKTIKHLHLKLFPFDTQETAREKDDRKETKHTKAVDLTLPEEKASSKKEDISKFVRNLTTRFSSAEIPVTVVTLVGENRGASMQIGSDSAEREKPIHIHRGYKRNPDESSKLSTEKAESSHQKNNQPITEEEEETKSFINSNAQGVNDSFLLDSSVTERNPGVHLVLSYSKDDNSARMPEFSINKAEKLSYEPSVRRRCLRGLFMESSDSDPDNSEKPRRHGCRYNCTDKKIGQH